MQRIALLSLLKYNLWQVINKRSPHFSHYGSSAYHTEIYSQWSNYAVAHSPCRLFSAWINTGLHQWATLRPPEGPQRLMLVIMPQLLFVCTHRNPQQKFVWYKSNSWLSYWEDSWRWVCVSFTKTLTLEFSQVDQSVVPDNPGRNRDLLTCKLILWLESLCKWNLYSVKCNHHSLENFRGNFSALQMKANYICVSCTKHKSENY